MTEPNTTEPKGVQPVSLDWKFTGKPGYKDFRPLPEREKSTFEDVADFSADLDPEDKSNQGETDAPDPKLSSAPASANYSASALKRETELKVVAEMAQEHPAMPSTPTLQSANHAAAAREVSKDETS